MSLKLPRILNCFFKIQFLFCDMLITLGRITSIFGRFGPSPLLPSPSWFGGSSPGVKVPAFGGSSPGLRASANSGRARCSRAQQPVSGEWLWVGGAPLSAGHHQILSANERCIPVSPTFYCVYN